MRSIGLVACGKGKLDHPAPARDLYTGQLFRFARAYCEREYDTWWVLSAKHGLVHPDAVIAPYDQTLAGAPVEERRQWARLVADQLWALAIQGRFSLHAGEAYAGFLADQLSVTERPLRGLAIGQQLKWYKERLG